MGASVLLLLVTACDDCSTGGVGGGSGAPDDVGVLSWRGVGALAVVRSWRGTGRGFGFGFGGDRTEEGGVPCLFVDELEVLVSESESALAFSSYSSSSVSASANLSSSSSELVPLTSSSCTGDARRTFFADRRDFTGLAVRERFRLRLRRVLRDTVLASSCSSLLSLSLYGN